MPIGTFTDVSCPRVAALRTAAAIMGATLAWLSVTTPVLAAPPDPPADVKAEADARYSRGRELYNRGEWEAALGEFAASRKLRANWAVTAGVAFCLAKLHRYDEALDTFEVVLRAYGDELAPRTRADAEAQIDELRRHVGLLDVGGAEPGAAISVDGRGRGAYPLAAPLRLAEGMHVVLAQKDGFEPYVTSVDVAAGRTTHVGARMRPLGRPEQPPAGIPESPAVAQATSGRRVGAFVVGGLGVAGLAIGAITGGLVLGKKPTVDANCGIGGDPGACNPTGFAAANDLKTLGLTSTIGFAAGAAALVTAVVLFATEPKANPSGARQAPWVSVTVAPIGGSAAAAAVQGAW